ncbi:MAG: hypothetical protein ABGX16_19335 [Pirellulales bacterium]
MVTLLAGASGEIVMLLTVCELKRVIRTRRRRCRSMVSALAIVMLGATGQLQAQQVLYLEDFESVQLMASPEEDPGAGNVWSETGPDGWTIDDSLMPPNTSPDPLDAACVNPGDCDGVTDWNGWAFVDKQLWFDTADQGRSAYTRGLGTIMVADSDEWKDAAILPSSRLAPTDWYDALATGPVINIPAGILANKVFMAFDSIWRPEGMDEEDGTNNQTATLEVSYDGGPFQTVLEWDSDPDSNTFKTRTDEAFNEAVELDGVTLGHDGIATTMQLKFYIGQAGTTIIGVWITCVSSFLPTLQFLLFIGRQDWLTLPVAMSSLQRLTRWTSSVPTALWRPWVMSD